MKSNIANYLILLCICTAYVSAGLTTCEQDQLTASTKLSYQRCLTSANPNSVLRIAGIGFVPNEYYTYIDSVGNFYLYNRLLIANPPAPTLVAKIPRTSLYGNQGPYRVCVQD